MPHPPRSEFRPQLRVLATPKDRSVCRRKGCAATPVTALGHCQRCDAIYQATRELYGRRVEWCWDRIEPTYGELLGDLSADEKRRLRSCLAAYAARPEICTLQALDEFLERLAAYRRLVP